MASIAVYCGSSSGSSETFAEAATDLGTALAAGGHRLVYGGGHVGLMGAVADAVLGGGGAVTGVITEHLRDLEVAHQGLDDLEVVADMHARKARMVELADGVVVLPGGFGTLDETFEVLTWNQLGLVRLPVVFLDLDGFYAPLFDYVDGAASSGFLRAEHAGLPRRASSVAGALELALTPAADYRPKWVT